MMVMTFEATCSPCTTQFVKNRNADQFSEEFPRAMRSIKENRYVDDLMDIVPRIHKHGGFYIRNWVFNSPSVLKAQKAEPEDKVNLKMGSEHQSLRLITEATQLLRLPKEKTRTEIGGFGATSAVTALSKVEVVLEPRFNSD